MQRVSASNSLVGRVRCAAKRLRQKWHYIPLTARLVAITTFLLVLGLTVSSMAITSMLQRQLLGQIDGQLQATAQAIGSQGLQQIQSGSESTMPSTYFVQAQYEDGEVSSTVSQDTAETYGTPIIGELSLEEALAQMNDPVLWTVDSDREKHQWRVVMLPISNRSTGEYVGVVAIALPLSDVEETTERMRLAMILFTFLVTIGGGLAATYLVRRSLQPLRQIEGVAGRIAAGDLSARVENSEPQTSEVGSLQRSLNAMLTQNEHAFGVRVAAQNRMQRFVSDASHELRTPLSAIRGYGELYRMGGIPQERTGEVMGRIEDEATRMGKLVEDLLQLARMDEGRPLEITEIDLTSLAATALGDLLVLAPERPTEVVALDGVSEAEPLLVRGDKDRLSQVLTNLLSNALRYTPVESPIEIAVGTEAEFALVEVRDHGPGVPQEDSERVFERFYRADTSRNRETGGSGLGLAIVSAILEAHGGSVAIVETSGGGATVQLRLPLPA